MNNIRNQTTGQLSYKQSTNPVFSKVSSITQCQRLQNRKKLQIHHLLKLYLCPPDCPQRLPFACHNGETCLYHGHRRCWFQHQTSPSSRCGTEVITDTTPEATPELDPVGATTQTFPEPLKIHEVTCTEGSFRSLLTVQSHAAAPCPRPRSTTSTQVSACISAAESNNAAKHKTTAVLHEFHITYLEAYFSDLQYDLPASTLSHWFQTASNDSAFLADIPCSNHWDTLKVEQAHCSRPPDQASHSDSSQQSMCAEQWVTKTKKRN